MSLQLCSSPGRRCSLPGRATSRTVPAATSGTTRICPGHCMGKVRALQTPERTSAPGVQPTSRVQLPLVASVAPWGGAVSLPYTAGARCRATQLSRGNWRRLIRPVCSFFYLGDSPLTTDMPALRGGDCPSLHPSVHALEQVYTQASTGCLQNLLPISLMLGKGFSS